jgi:hypothetical protein
MFVPYNRTFGTDIRNNTIKNAIGFNWAGVSDFWSIDLYRSLVYKNPTLIFFYWNKK